MIPEKNFHGCQDTCSGISTVRCAVAEDGEIVVGVSPASGGHTFVSTDMGATFEAKAVYTNDGGAGLALAAKYTGYYVVSGTRSKLYTSNDQAESWTFETTLPNGACGSAYDIQDVACNDENEDEICGSFAYCTMQSVADFAFGESGTLYAIRTHPAGDKINAALFWSVDSGATWNIATTPWKYPTGFSSGWANMTTALYETE